MIDQELILYYLAGFIDAEGSFVVHMVGGSRSTKKYPRPELAVTNSEYKILKFMEITYGGKVYKKSKVNKKYKQLYVYTLCGPKLIIFIENILNKLLSKKGQAALTLSLLKTKRTHQTHDGSKLDEKLILKRQKIIEKLKVLKRKNCVIEQPNPSYIEKDIYNININNLAYLAGFIDGDGGLGAVNKSSSTITGGIRFYNTDIKVLKRIQNIIGGKIGNSRLPKTAKKTQHTLFTGTKTRRFLIKKLIPFLIIKRKEALLFLEYEKYNSSKQENRKKIILELKKERHSENRIKELEKYPKELQIESGLFSLEKIPM